MSAKNPISGCKPCVECKVWKKLTTDPRYRQPVTTRSIGAEREVIFLYMPRVCEVLVALPCQIGKLPVLDYPHKFTEAQFKMMCCRLCFVTNNALSRRSAFVGNNGEFNSSKQNPPGWNPPKGLFGNSREARKDAPYLVAVVRKVLEHNRPLDKRKYCPCQSNCK